MLRRVFQLCLLSTLTSLSTAFAEEPPVASIPIMPGVRPDQSVLLPNQWSLRPAGAEVKLENFPVNVAIHPRGDYAAVLHSGYGPHVVSIVKLRTAKVVSSEALPKTFYGISFSPDGTRLIVGGGEDNVIYRYRFADGKLADRETIKLQHAEKALVPTGMACSRYSESLYVACCLGQSLRVISLQHPEQQQSIELPRDSYPYAVLPAATFRSALRESLGKVGGGSRR